MSHTHAHDKSYTSNTPLDIFHPDGSISYSLPSQLKQGECFIQDDIAKQTQPFQESRNFLWTGTQPYTSQRTETQITFTNGLWVQMSGIIDTVHPCPLFGDKSNGIGGCTHRLRYVKRFGGHPHHIIIGRGILHSDFYDRHQDVIDKNTVYRMTYEMDWDKKYMWILTKLEPIEKVTTTKDKNEETISPVVHFQQHHLANVACPCQCMKKAPDGGYVPGTGPCQFYGTSTSSSSST